MKLLDVLFLGYVVGKNMLETSVQNTGTVVIIAPKAPSDAPTVDTVRFHVGASAVEKMNELPMIERPVIDFYIPADWHRVKH